MFTRIRPAVLLLAAALLASPATTQPADLVISSGVKDRNYHAVAMRLRTRLAQDAELHAVVLESRGSLENLDRLRNPLSPVGVVLTQADALEAHLAAHPEQQEKLEILADVGKECGILVVNAAGPIQKAGDLKAEGERRIAVGRDGSGAAVTWARIAETNPGFARTRAEPEGAVEALARIKSGDPAAPDAVLFVQRPRAVSSALEVVIQNPAQFRVVPFDAEDLTIPAMRGGDPVYSIEKATMRNLEFDALCTRGLLVVSTEKVGEDVRHGLSQTLLHSEQYIVPSAK